MKRRSIIYVVLAVLAVLTAVVVVMLSRGGNGYLCVIPKGAKALVAVDFSKMQEGNKANADGNKALKQWLGIEGENSCGIDFGRKAYLFEASDGSLGLVAAVDSKGDVESWLQSLYKSGKATKTTERKGYQFAVVNDNFLVGISSSALLVMGPVVGDEQSQLQRKMVKYLSSDKDVVSDTPLFRQLSEMEGAVTMVAQADALPDKIVMPLTLGSPRGTKADRLLIAATMDIGGECLTFTCRTFSFDEKVNETLKASRSRLKPVSGKYLSSISADNLLTVACGTKGTDFVELLRSNETIRTMLIGINTAIDIDKMLRGVDGDLIISVPSLGDNVDLSLLADVCDVSWQGDVDYWKKSCPAGARIEDCGTDCYHLSGKEFNAWFGVKDGKLLYVAPTSELAERAGEKAANPLSADVADKVKGGCFVAVLSIASAGRQNPELSVVSSLLPQLKTVVLKIE